MEIIQEVLQSGIFVKGSQAEFFEQEFRHFLGNQYALTTNSGTSALFLAYSMLDLQKDDEIITTSHTFFATISPALYFHVKPVFIDISDSDYNLNPDIIEEKITSKTKAIVPVHMYGNPCNMDKLDKISKKYHIPIIEDCAQSIGSKYRGKYVGSFGDFSCFSFFPSKTMSVLGDGGMISLNHSNMYERMKMVRNNGRQSKYLHESMGLNLRLSEIHAAIGRSQLKNLPKYIQRRKQIVQRYTEAFTRIPQITLRKPLPDSEPVNYVYTIEMDNRTKFIEYLHAHGIATGIYYPVPVHQQPIIIKQFGQISLPQTEQVVQKIVSIPLYPTMIDAEIDYVINIIKEFPFH